MKQIICEKIFCGIFLLCIASPSFALSCAPPVFTEIETLGSQVHKKTDDLQASTFRINNTISIDLPATPANIKVLPSEEIFFESKSGDFYANIYFESKDDLEKNGLKDLLPYTMYEQIFESPKEEHCIFLENFDISKQDYRVRILLENGKIFAFGSKNTHYFYILNHKNPNSIAIVNIKTSEINHIYNVLNNIKFNG